MGSFHETDPPGTRRDGSAMWANKRLHPSSAAATQGMTKSIVSCSRRG